MMERDFCKPIENMFRLLKPTKISLVEKFFLFFVKTKTDLSDENVFTKYKTFRGKLYILDQYILPPKGWNCRCDIEIIKDLK